jgi:hypothetical protein
MSVRVNLLRPEEIKQANSVNREAMLRMAGMVGGAAVAAAVIFLFFQYRSVIGGYARAQGEFAEIETEYNRVKGMQESSALNHRYVTELKSWTSSRVRWDESLFAIQGLVPSNIQLTRMSLNGEIKLSNVAPANKDDPVIPARFFALRLEGKAQGNLSDQDVIRFVDGIRSDESLQSWLSNVKLQGLHRSTDGGTGFTEDGQAERTFRLDATSGERVMR